MTIQEMQREATENAANKGFTPDIDNMSREEIIVWVKLGMLAMIASEVGEAVEAVRMGDEEGLELEMADILLRCGHFAGFTGIELQNATVTKALTNRQRPFKHGGKKA